MSVYKGEMGEQGERVHDDEVIVHTHTIGTHTEVLVTIDGDDGQSICPNCDFSADGDIVDDDGYSYYSVNSEYHCMECGYIHEDESQVKRHYTMDHTEEVDDSSE